MSAKATWLARLPIVQYVTTLRSAVTSQPLAGPPQVRQSASDPSSARAMGDRKMNGDGM
ncbi:MAG: hypothetical protein ABI611_12705 [Solirubrobacteraceae bacterium]